MSEKFNRADELDQSIGSLPSVEGLLEAYRAGDESAGNQLWQRYGPWLGLLARGQLESRFQAKFDPADLVQQTLLEAVRAFPRFRGRTEPELAAWLRQILVHVLAHEIRRYRGTRKRDIDLEQSLHADLGASSQRLENTLATSATSPSVKMLRQEQHLRLASVLERLPADMREVIVLRHIEGWSHDRIAQRLQRSPGAVRMLWVRALARLREEMQAATGAGGRTPER